MKSENTDSGVNGEHITFALNAIRRLGKVSDKYKNCLIKSLTLKYLLKVFKINSNVVLGVKTHQGRSLQAHAYLEINEHYHFFKLPRFYNFL